MVSDVLGVSSVAHNSLEDVRALQKLVSNTSVREEEIMKPRFSDLVLTTARSIMLTRLLIYTLQTLIAALVITKRMAERIASANLQLCHMNLTFQRSGLEGLSSNLLENINRPTKVKRSKRITLQLYNYFTGAVYNHDFE